MKKYFIVLIFSALSSYSFSQVMIDRAGELSFFSKTPVEDISAKNNTAQSALNLSSKEVAVKASIKDFVFPQAL
ncbi:MAG: YceI family protein, partial [Cytophagales bacterium]|nr:YceI family protein [Cytophagales bacterium]